MLPVTTLSAGHIIEIDESAFGKRNYHRGIQKVGKWVLDGYCKTTGECFLLQNYWRVFPGGES